MHHFQKLKINNFGPIKSTGTKMLDFKRCTVFIGDQGTGKSTIVKVYSTLTWLEKAIVAKKIYNGKFSIKDIKNLFSQQNIPSEYFTDKTNIEYDSNVLHISIIASEISISKKTFINDEYKSPQIQYIPSERNLLSISNSLNSISGLPEILNQFSLEFKNAKDVIDEINFQKYIFKHDKKRDFDYVVYAPDSSKVSLKQASSGIQSLFPLLFVSRFFSQNLKKSFFERLVETDNNRRQIVLSLIDNNEIYNIVNNFITSGIDKELKKIEKSKFETLFGNIVDSCFVEIVEEPEQNLYPTSQIELLNNILIDTNREFDKLILTTHSPYILSQINNYIYANQIYKKYNKTIKEINKNLFINFSDVSAYKIKEGKIKNIIDKDYEGVDVLEIDECSRNINLVFDKLVNINE